jgi:hypothetical protein
MRLRTAGTYNAPRFSHDDWEKATEGLSLLLVDLQQDYRPLADFSKASPEVKLLHAVLEDAIDCFRRRWTRKGKNSQRFAQEAEVWFFSDDLVWPFSFLNVCATLEIDPDYLRRGLRRWYQEPPAAGPRRRRPFMPTGKSLKIAA